MTALWHKATVLPKNVTESGPTKSRYPSRSYPNWLNPRERTPSLWNFVTKFCWSTSKFFHCRKLGCLLKRKLLSLHWWFLHAQNALSRKAFRRLPKPWMISLLEFVPVANGNLPCRATLTFSVVFSRPFEQHFHAECRHDVEVAGAGRLGLRHCQW